MKALYLFFLILTFLVVSCGTEPTDENTSCSPSCKSSEECIDGACKLKDNNCNQDSDCPDTDTCNLSTNLCELSACNPKCEGWEECQADTGVCTTKVGRCAEDSLCTNPSKPVCNELHYCVEQSNDCIKECSSDSDCDADDICDTSDTTASKFYCLSTSGCDTTWQYCYEGTCETRQGFCDDNNPCTTIDLPLCDTQTHLCMPQETGCNPQCDSWQMCNTEEQCTTAPGFCAVNADCLISPNKPICNTQNHVCTSEEINFLQAINLNIKSLIITKAAFKDKFEEIAMIHTLTGTHVEVVTIEDICGTFTCNDNDPKVDTASAIKAYLKTRQNEIKYVLLGGDIEIVPSRQVHDKYYKDVAGYYTVDIEEDFYTDYYFADFADWDTNNNGVYAENNGDNLGDYRPEIAVSRLSVSNETELDNYIEKLKIYMFDYHAPSVEYVLMLTNVASEVASVHLDAAQYFEMDDKTVDIIEGNTIGANIDFQKLYQNSSSNWDAEKLNCNSTTSTTCNIIAAIEGDWPDSGHRNDNPNLVVHMGHGGVHTLMVEQTGENAFTGDMAYNLDNYIPNILLSCACQAGTFSASDSAGEKLINAPNGGAIIYLGDSATGLGLGGGAQLIDEFIRFFYNNKNIIIGDAIFAAHQNMPERDILDLPVIGTTIPIDALDKDSYEWTQKVATVLGDLFIPIWNTQRTYLSDIIITQWNINQQPNASDLSIRSNTSFPANTYITILTDTGNYYEIDLSSQQDVTKELNEKPSYIYYGIRSETAFYVFDRKDF